MSADADERTAAATALGKRSDKRALDLLILRLKDKNSDVREAAAEALGNLGDARAVQPLIEKLGRYDRGRNRSFTAVTVCALGKLGDSRAVDPLLEGLQDSSDPSIRNAAKTALAKMSDQRAIDALKELATGCPVCGCEVIERRKDYGNFSITGGGISVISSHCNNCGTRSNVAYMCKGCTSYLSGNCIPPTLLSKIKG